MNDTRTTCVIDGLAFPEGPRWRDGQLWFSDQHDRRVVALTPDGIAETVVDVPEQPSGLGWLPDGRMLVVSMRDRRVLRLDDGKLVEHADLSALAPNQCNDMVVDAQGRAYVGNFGFDIYIPEKPIDTSLILVELDGAARIVGVPLAFPNGTVITPDGKTLIVGESMGRRLRAFDIEANGDLSNPRVFAKIKAATCDGICLDAEGAIWVACPLTGRCMRIADGGEILDEVQVIRSKAYACMLGGPDRRTLYLCTAETSEPDEARKLRSGCIEMVEVDVPGAGLP